MRALIVPGKLAGGHSSSIACDLSDPKEFDFILNALRAWIEEATEGEEIVFSWLEISRRDFRAMPEL